MIYHKRKGDNSIAADLLISYFRDFLLKRSKSVFCYVSDKLMIDRISGEHSVENLVSKANNKTARFIDNNNVILKDLNLAKLRDKSFETDNVLISVNKNISDYDKFSLINFVIFLLVGDAGRFSATDIEKFQYKNRDL